MNAENIIITLFRSLVYRLYAVIARRDYKKDILFIACLGAILLVVPVIAMASDIADAHRQQASYYGEHGLHDHDEEYEDYEEYEEVDAFSKEAFILSTTYPVYLIVNAIVPGNVKVGYVSSATDHHSSHHFHPSFTDLQWMDRADLIITIRKEAYDLISQKVSKPHKIISFHHHLSDEHDMHIWMSLDRVQQIALETYKQVSILLPSKEVEEMKKRYDAFIAKLDQVALDIRAVIYTIKDDQIKRCPVVADHQAFSYFSEYWDINVDAYLHNEHYDQLVAGELTSLKKLLYTVPKFIFLKTDDHHHSHELLDHILAVMGSKAAYEVVSFDPLFLNSNSETFLDDYKTQCYKLLECMSPE